LGKSWILLVHLILHYSAFLAMTIFYNPEKEISSGLHETVGPCEETLPVNTAFGMVHMLSLHRNNLFKLPSLAGATKEKILVSRRI
jgi:hypothetical protein